MGPATHSLTRNLEAQQFAKLPFDPAKVHYDGSSIMINPEKQYPKEYEEFMNSDGYWDFYGPFHYAFDAYSIISEEEVDKIIETRK
jgi:hypothetical protein